jgi:hypothetical protein
MDDRRVMGAGYALQLQRATGITGRNQQRANCVTSSWHLLAAEAQVSSGKGAVPKAAPFCNISRSVETTNSSSVKSNSVDRRFWSGMGFLTL